MCRGRKPPPLTAEHWSPPKGVGELNSSVFNDPTAMQDDTRAVARYISQRHSIGDMQYSASTNVVIGAIKYHLKVSETTARKIMKEMINPNALDRGRIYGISVRR